MKGKSKPPLPKYPPNQEGKRLSPDELQQAIERKDHEKLSQEGQYALEKLVWLRSPEQATRPDRDERERSLNDTQSMIASYLIPEIVAGRKSLAGSRKGVEITLKKTRDKRQGDHARMQAIANELHKSHPEWSRTEISKRVAKIVNNVSARTVFRYIQLIDTSD